MGHLVIVESPAKGKTIEKYLGKDYKVRASFGHIRDLPKKNMGIHIETFEPEYEVTTDKKKVINELKREVKNAESVIIATDEDREGEAIGWHLCHTLGLDVDTTKRIVFHEITKKAITKAVENPRKIDIDLVNAQQARRILDRIVGFETSPVLWRKIKSGLSAGRVQSVAVRLVVEKEREIQAFKPKESWKIFADCEAKNIAFRLELTKIAGKSAGLKKQEDVEKMFSHLGFTLKDFSQKEQKNGSIIFEKENALEFQVDEITQKASKRNPAAPFTTSTLQQEASRKLGFSVKQTMAVAQNLYQHGHITYMRTDSVNLSQHAIDMSKQFIESEYGEKYVKTRKYATKSSGAQEAHEAIRPAYIDKTPKNCGLSDTDLKLYTLIWNRTVASQMMEADIMTTTYNCSPIELPDQTWTTKGQVITFPGFMKLYIEGSDEDNTDDTLPENLPDLKEKEIFLSKKISGVQSFSRPPARYTEATLVKKLESEGIGRPSTYAPTISTIMDRGYIEKIKKHLHPSDLAFLVNDFLVENFSNFMEYKFTANIESEFDIIATGKLNWKKMLRDFYTEFHPMIEKTGEAERMTGERLLGEDPKTNKPVSVRMGRFWPLAQIGDRKDENKRFAGLLPDQSIETITLEQALELFNLPRVVGKYGGTDILANIGRFGPYVQMEKTYASLPKDGDINIYNVTLKQAIELIEKKKDLDKNKFVHTWEEEGIQVLRGPYGIYIKANKKNYKIPKSIDAEKITLEQCKEIIGK